MPQVILLTDVARDFGYGKYAGAYKIATEIRRSGYSCQVIDNYVWIGAERLKHVFDKFISEETFLLGISCTLNEKRLPDGTMLLWGINEPEFMELLRYAKQLNPNLKIVVGGSKITQNSHWEIVDYSIINKADAAIVKLIDHLVNGADLKYEVIGGCTKLIKDTDYPYTQEEFSRSQILFEKNDIIFPGEALPIEVARGCIFSCSFCKFDLIGKKSGEWTKSADTLRAEFMRNYEMFGTTRYNISDELINESVDKLKMLRDVASSLPFQLKYTAYARIDLIWRFPEMRELSFGKRGRVTSLWD